MGTEPLNELVQRYVTAWNEPDPQHRSQELGKLYASDGCVVTQSGSFVGMKEVAEHIGAVHKEFIGSGRFRFKSGGAIGHHDCVLFRWEMLDVKTGGLADAGMNLFLLTGEGRIVGDYQFALGVDSSIGSAVAI